MIRKYLFPGKIAVSKEAIQIVTNLGSCVAVALWDPKERIGGLNHFLLPDVPTGTRRSNRFGSIAIQELLKKMLETGAKRENLQAKVCGGASLLDGFAAELSVGQKNIQKALTQLSELGIPIVEQDVGGSYPRTIRFSTATGKIQQTLRKVDPWKAEYDTTGFGKVWTPKNINVLIVDPNPNFQRILINIFKKHSIKVAGTAGNAYEAREMIIKKKPTALVLDVNIPGINGIEFLKKVMRHFPLPTVMLSPLSGKKDKALFDSLKVGAVDLVRKPNHMDVGGLQASAEVLVHKIRAAAYVSAVGTHARKLQIPDSYGDPTQPGPELKKMEVIAIGGNTGCLNSVEALLTRLPADLPPIVLASSTVAAVSQSLIKQCKGKSRLNIVEARSTQALRRGHFYILPNAFHGRFLQTSAGFALNSLPGHPVCFEAPSADVLFNSAANTFREKFLAILLGGFGADGLTGLDRVHSVGGLSYIQTPGEAISPYTPRQAISRGLGDHVVSVENIIQSLGYSKEKKAA